MRDSPLLTWVNAAVNPVQPSTSISSSGRSTLGSIEATIVLRAARLAGMGSASSGDRWGRPWSSMLRRALSPSPAATPR